jgi:hypothetical protein
MEKEKQRTGRKIRLNAIANKGFTVTACIWAV